MDTIQKQRYELKYVIPEHTALQIRDFVRCYLDMDQNGTLDGDLSYPVHSLYLDSPGMALYRSTINGDKNRIKLRIRFYNERPETPVFLEIKRRMNNIISKKRIGIPRRLIQAVLSGEILEHGNADDNSSPGLENLNSYEQDALLEFSERVNALEAHPVSHVAYRREAWTHSDSNAVRVTMDRHVRCEADLEARLSTTMQKPTLVFGDWVILELKFTDRFPNWFRELVEVFNLAQCGAAKYVDGVTLMGQDQVADLITTHKELHFPGSPAMELRDHIERRKKAIAATF
jgi:SPX domain protein involved in polyphosphate accumulation